MISDEARALDARHRPAPEHGRRDAERARARRRRRPGRRDPAADRLARRLGLGERHDLPRDPDLEEREEEARGGVLQRDVDVGRATTSRWPPDHLVAHPASVTGSIGVIMPGISIEGLMEKYGVADQTLTSGPYKDAGSILRDMRPDGEEAAAVGDRRSLRAASPTSSPPVGPVSTRRRSTRSPTGASTARSRRSRAGLVDQLGYLEDAVAQVQKTRGHLRVAESSSTRAAARRPRTSAASRPSLSLQSLQLAPARAPPRPAPLRASTTSGRSVSLTALSAALAAPVADSRGIAVARHVDRAESRVRRRLFAQEPRPKTRIEAENAQAHDQARISAYALVVVVASRRS